MSNPVISGAYFDGDYSTAVSIGAIVFEAPFKDCFISTTTPGIMDNTPYIWRQRYHVHKESYSPVAIGATWSGTGSYTVYHCGDSPLRDTEVAGIVEFESTGVRLPTSHNQYAASVIARQELAVIGMSTTLVEWQEYEKVRFQVDFYCLGVTLISSVTFTNPLQIPILKPVVYSIQTIGAAKYLFDNSGTVPGVSDTERVGVATEISCWMGPIFMAKTGYINKTSGLTLDGAIT